MSSTATLTHLDGKGAARMVDVGEKAVTPRIARAEGFITMPETLIRQLAALKKGDAYATARLAGIMGGKRTAELIPLCHALPLDALSVQLEPEQNRVRVVAEARCHGKTGVEMEALTAVSIALLTLYDMGKAVARGMEIGGIRLLHKSGGRSGVWEREGSENQGNRERDPSP